MQSKLDKVVSFVEESADKNKSFLQKFFNRSPKNHFKLTVYAVSFLFT
ncbi:hypothetical protein AAHB94_31140 [Bacillus toyonensis]